MHVLQIPVACPALNPFKKKYFPKQEEIRLQNAETSVVLKDVGEEITATVTKAIKTKPVQLETQVF
jgi:hypothetical protein